MPPSPPYKRNQYKKRVELIFDLSCNNIFDLSNSLLDNSRLFSSFQDSKEIKNTICAHPPPSNRNCEQKNLNRRFDNFKKKMDTILEQIRKEREDNTKKKTHIHNYQKFIKTLDDISNNKNKTKVVKSPTSSKADLDSLLAKINNKYNLLSNKSLTTKLLEDKTTPRENNISKNIFGPRSYNNYSTSWTFPPPPPLPLRIPPLNIKMPPPPPPPLPPPPPRVIRTVNIDREINSLGDILKLIDDYPIESDVEYNIDMKSIHRIKEPLCELNSMIGMKELKNNIVDQVIYFMQDFHSVHKKNQDFMHTVIYGPPGTGKTEIAKIIGKIFCNMGVLTRNVFKKATRSDLIAGYLGQTAIKTRDIMQDCLGGVLFIDEAYALGNPEKRDSFAKECIDTLCEGLSDNKENLMVIIAGYEEDLNKCFFSYNQGLNSRFPWRFKTDDYSAEDLNLIFQKKIKDAGWSLQEPLHNSWFDKQMDYFKYYGRDMETLFSKTKIAHSRRVFCRKKEDKTKITKIDLEKGLKMFLDNNEVQARKSDNNMCLEAMYL